MQGVRQLKHVTGSSTAICPARPHMAVPCCNTYTTVSQRQVVRPDVCVHNHEKSKASFAVSLVAAASILAADPASAMGQKVGEFAASGLLFKDTVEITALDDPEVNGVTIYVSDFKRSIVDKLAKDFFSEPSQASLTCEITGPVSLRQGSVDKLGGKDGQEMFSEQKGLNLFKNKTLRIRRVYDTDRNSLVYVAYSTRLSTAADEGSVSSGRYRTSLCALRLPDSILAPPPAAANN